MLRSMSLNFQARRITALNIQVKAPEGRSTRPEGRPSDIEDRSAHAEEEPARLEDVDGLSPRKFT